MNSFKWLNSMELGKFEYLVSSVDEDPLACLPPGFQHSPFIFLPSLKSLSDPESYSSHSLFDSRNSFSVWSSWGHTPCLQWFPTALEPKSKVLVGHGNLCQSPYSSLPVPSPKPPFYSLIKVRFNRLMPAASSSRFSILSWHLILSPPPFQKAASTIWCAHTADSPYWTPSVSLLTFPTFWKDLLVCLLSVWDQEPCVQKLPKP